MLKQLSLLCRIHGGWRGTSETKTIYNRIHHYCLITNEYIVYTGTFCTIFIINFPCDKVYKIGLQNWNIRCQILANLS